MFKSNRTFLKRAACFAALALASASTQAMATDKALLIGVGNFIYLQNANLPGIDKDVAMMEGVAQRLGYTQIAKLEDKDATKKAILDRLERLLVTEASSNDRVLVYFSGHGTGLADDNGDEDDGQDEALLASDTRIGQTADGTPSIGGVILDDDIGALLARAKVKSVTLIVDSCHSGTVDKSVTFVHPVMGNKTGMKKVFMWPGFRAGGTKGFAVGSVKSATGPTVNYVSMTAAGDNQFAQATRSGSMFTVGITQAIANASDGNITPRQIVESASKYIAGETSPTDRFNPEVHGSPALIDAPIRLSRTDAGGGPNWNQVLQIAGQLPEIPVSGLRDRYTDGQDLQLTLDLPSDGYLNVIAVGADDSVTLLYPNYLQPDSRVKAGRLALPGDVPANNGRQLYFPVAAPYGKTMVLAILTKAPKNLYASAADANGNKGLRTPSFADVQDLINTSQNATRVRTFHAGEQSTTGGGTTTGPSAWAVKAEMLTCGPSGC